VTAVVCRLRRALKAFNMSLIMPGVTPADAPSLSIILRDTVDAHFL